MHQINAMMVIVGSFTCFFVQNRSFSMHFSCHLMNFSITLAEVGATFLLFRFFKVCLRIFPFSKFTTLSQTRLLDCFTLLIQRKMELGMDNNNDITEFPNMITTFSTYFFCFQVFCCFTSSR